MKGRGQAVIRQEQGYALVSVLLLVAILLVIGTLVMQSVTNSQGMVNVSEDIVSAQADGETKLLIKLSELRAAVMALKDKDKLTLDDVKVAADKYVEPGTVTLDNENQRYIAIVKADGVSDQVTQTYRRKVEITLSFTPGNPSPGTGTGGYAVVSYGALDSVNPIINGNIYVAGSFNPHSSTINGTVVTPTSSPGSGLKPPDWLNITTMINQVDQDIITSKSTLFSTPPTQLGSEIRTNTKLSNSTVLNSAKLMSNVMLTVEGDLWVNGDMTMEVNSSIVASGIIYISGDLLINGGNNVKLQATLIRVKGKTNLNSDPTVNFGGDFYGTILNSSGTILANKIYLTDKFEGKLKGTNQMYLFTAKEVTLNDDNSPSNVNGSIYANGSIKFNGNNKLTINGTTSPPATPEKPSEIKFEEKNIVIN
ncbi:MAG: hypothetical protein E6Y08_08280 [Paenibacillus sp.]|uniref:hypothetical protein n=1 Tax=Paenibacillus sp. TaxID=58172 RepID=UPI0029072DB4|nr:hypothetical protein [Paenibacillus sp.]MDU4695799.1 hypothetical protein [Paenibacillus sp.]